MRLFLLLVIVGFCLAPAFADDTTTSAATNINTSIAAPSTTATLLDDDNATDHPMGDIFRTLKRWDAWIRQNLW